MVRMYKISGTMMTTTTTAINVLPSIRLLPLEASVWMPSVWLVVSVCARVWKKCKEWWCFALFGECRPANGYGANRYHTIKAP